MGLTTGCWLKTEDNPPRGIHKNLGQIRLGPRVAAFALSIGSPISGGIILYVMFFRKRRGYFFII